MIIARTSLCLMVSLAMALALLAPLQKAHAAWPFTDGGPERSGLDLSQGYDRNTVVTITGRVAALPDNTADPVTVEVVAGSERLVVVLGPRWFLQDDDLDWKVGDQLVARGSRAQGKDGRSYLLAQWVTGPSGASVVLRTPSGHPGWVRGGRSDRQGSAVLQGSGGGRKGR